MATEAYDPWGDRNDPKQGALKTARTIGMWLFLASLFMLFVAMLIGYGLIRWGATKSPEQAIEKAPVLMPVAWGSLHMPMMLWVSTFLVVGVSVCLGVGLHHYRRGMQRTYRSWLIVAMVLAVGFVSVQAPAMIQMVLSHRSLAGVTGRNLYMLIFTLVLVHALHVIGGMIPLTKVTIAAARGVNDDKHAASIRYTVMYWHFLDIVWLVMFVVLMILR